MNNNNNKSNRRRGKGSLELWRNFPGMYLMMFNGGFPLLFSLATQNWEVMNTAVLTGRQVSQAMKVFIVSQAGKVADVTLQSSCHAEDESVIKVSKTFIYYQLRGKGETEK